MSKIMSLIRRAPKRFAALTLMAAAAIIVPAAGLAWGPDRPTFTYANPAPYVTFNSITDNPSVGDERNFVRVREAGTGNYTDNVNLQAGKTYEVMVYYHNNASTGLNASGAGIAKDVALRMQMESTVAASKKTDIAGFIKSSNAKPAEVYDTATLNNGSAGAMDLSFVSGSAKVTSNGKVNGSTLSNSVFSTGAKLGFDALDGKVPGCNKYAGYVIFKIKADQPNFTVNKQVRKTGETAWSESKAVKAGDSLEYLVTYKNTGTTNQNNVVLKDTLPQGISYVSGTTYVANATNPQGLKLGSSSDTATTTGVNIGSYAPGAAAYVKYSVKVASNDHLPVCGKNSLTNKAEIRTQNGTKSDTTTVTVDKECKPVVKDIKVCELATKKIITIKEDQFDSKKHSKNLDDCKEVVKNIKVCELSTKKIITINEKDFDAKKHSKNLDDCKEVVVKDIKVCELSTKKIITIKENAFDSSKHSKNLDDCKVVVKDIKVCELSTKKIITIKENQFDSKKHSKNLDDCKVVVKDIKVCELSTKKIITIKENAFDSSKHSKNLDDCKEIVKKIEVCELSTKKIITINEKDFDAKKHSKNLDDCKEIVKNVKVCELATKKIITINEKDFDSKKHSMNLDDCKEVVVKDIKVCELSTKKIITIKENAFDATKHSKDLKDCKEVEVKEIKVCEISTKEIVTIKESDFNDTKYTKDLSKCEETPVTPPELPKTGMGESIVAIFGLGAMIASAAYYIASRRTLNQ